MRNCVILDEFEGFYFIQTLKSICMYVNVCHTCFSNTVHGFCLNYDCPMLVFIYDIYWLFNNIHCARMKKNQLQTSLASLWDKYPSNHTNCVPAHPGLNQ